ncbi:hypothetical protein [Streptomyces sp. NPDC058466]|uniref:hypothetical protein n=1 Tax=unclassified Streptomyces TaxID=2593676 RepID=UPI0036640A67
MNADLYVAAILAALGPWGTFAFLTFLLIFAGVVLPTVWSRHAYRRTAARRTLDTLLKALRRLYPF